MRFVIAMAALAALSSPALAQQQPRAPGPPPARPAPQAQQAPQPPPGMFPCRSVSEICHVVAVGNGNQGTLLFSNAPAAESKEGEPVTVQGADLAAHAGRVVMLSGTFAGAAINGAQIIDVATPLASLAIKQQFAGGDDEPSPPVPQRSAPPPQQRR